MEQHNNEQSWRAINTCVVQFMIRVTYLETYFDILNIAIWTHWSFTSMACDPEFGGFTAWCITIDIIYLSAMCR